MKNSFIRVVYLNQICLGISWLYYKGHKPTFYIMLPFCQVIIDFDEWKMKQNDQH